ncbi:MAG: hypothetical protein WCF03_15250 [Nitrososphaeraceae archaeon]
MQFASVRYNYSELAGYIAWYHHHTERGRIRTPSVKKCKNDKIGVLSGTSDIFHPAG